MSDFPYPKPALANGMNSEVVDNPFPQQIRALELVRERIARESLLH